MLWLLLLLLLLLLQLCTPAEVKRENRLASTVGPRVHLDHGVIVALSEEHLA